MLDADKGERIESLTGRVASRAIVQFAAMRDVKSMHGYVSNTICLELQSSLFTDIIWTCLY